MITAAVDPGTKVCAVALFDDEDTLFHLASLSPDRGSWSTDDWWVLGNTRMRPLVVSVVCEKPQFDSRVSKHVIDLAWTGAAVAYSLAAGGPVTAYTPSAWKGSLQKPVHHHRIWQVLTPAERAVFPEGTEARIAEACRKGGLDNWRKPGAEYYGKAKGSEVHNSLDAVGLGLHHLGRYSEVGNLSQGRRSKRA